MALEGENLTYIRCQNANMRADELNRVTNKVNKLELMANTKSPIQDDKVEIDGK
jgi:hypothetical protein